MRRLRFFPPPSLVAPFFCKRSLRDSIGLFMGLLGVNLLANGAAIAADLVVGIARVVAYAPTNAMLLVLVVVLAVALDDFGAHGKVTSSSADCRW